MFHKLKELKNKGYVPDLIIDIGAHRGHWTIDMCNIYPKTNYILIEPTKYGELEGFKRFTNFRVYNEILNEKTEMVEWYSICGTGDSFFKEKTKHYVNVEKQMRSSVALNELMLVNKNEWAENGKNVFIKIDCQGAEIPILKGSSDILDKTDFILLELPLFGQYNENVPDFLEHLAFMKSIGFLPYEMLENHYVNGFNIQVDMLFINQKHEFVSLVQKLL